MKKILLAGILALCFSNLVFAQDPFERDSVFQSKDLSVKQIYDGLKKWFVTMSVSDSRNVIQVDDAQNGSLVGRITFDFKYDNLTWGASTGYITVVFDIKIRDGRYKVKLTDFTHISNHPKYADGWSLGVITEVMPAEWEKGWKFKQNRAVYKKVRERCEEIQSYIFSEIGSYMGNYKPVEEEDW